MTRPFRFGVFGEHARSAEALLDTARRAEDSGYSTFLIRDHFIEEPFGHQLAPLASLTAVAGATNRLRVGSLVLSNDYRHPVVLAKEIATLDVLSSGRVELGLGAGFSKAEYDGAGIPFDPPGIRVDRLEEAIHVLKGLFGEGPLTFHGKHYAVTALDGFPKPVQRPRPPLLIGAAGKRMLSIAAREADIVGFQTVSTARGMMSDDPSGRLASVVAQRVEQVRQDAGARFDGIELSMVATVVFAESRHRAAERFARERGWEGVSAEQVLEMPSVFIGSVDGIVDELRARRDQYGFSYYVVLDQAMEQVAPIVARLAGT
ncbi:MAG: TIGR03621 family F420-dependent LLM class oxidoreductase [Candidatus Rokuibacteriota bacterium]